VVGPRYGHKVAETGTETISICRSCPASIHMHLAFHPDPCTCTTFTSSRVQTAGTRMQRAARYCACVISSKNAIYDDHLANLEEPPRPPEAETTSSPASMPSTRLWRGQASLPPQAAQTRPLGPRGPVGWPRQARGASPGLQPSPRAKARRDEDVVARGRCRGRHGLRLVN
jgi:hypothetical protein